MVAKTVGLVYSEDFILHQTGQVFVDGPNVFLEIAGKRLLDPFYSVDFLRYYRPLPYGASHAERPERISLIYASLEATGLLPELTQIQPQTASETALARVHTLDYIASVQALTAAGGGFLGEGTLLSPRSYDIARLSAGAAITALDCLLKDELKSAFVLSRPPGHHAQKAKAAGFCIFNNVAVAAEHWLAARPNDRVLIIDWDVHHGDGTQAIFYEDERVFYFSTHQYGPPDLYPGTGAFDETGKGAGQGYTMNVPLPGKAGDKLYLEVFETLVPEVVAEFEPDIILVSAGQDGHFNDLDSIYVWDEAGGMGLTAQCYYRLTQLVRDLAEKYCGGKYLMLLEGGYNLRNLSNSVLNIVSAMLQMPKQVTETLPYNFPTVNNGANHLIKTVRQHHSS